MFQYEIRKKRDLDKGGPRRKGGGCREAVRGNEKATKCEGDIAEEASELRVITIFGV